MDNRQVLFSVLSWCWSHICTCPSGACSRATQVQDVFEAIWSTELCTSQRTSWLPQGDICSLFLLSHKIYLEWFCMKKERRNVPPNWSARALMWFGTVSVFWEFHVIFVDLFLSEVRSQVIDSSCLLISIKMNGFLSSHRNSAVTALLRSPAPRGQRVRFVSQCDRMFK